MAGADTVGGYRYNFVESPPDELVCDLSVCGQGPSTASLLWQAHALRRAEHTVTTALSVGRGLSLKKQQQVYTCILYSSPNTSV